MSTSVAPARRKAAQARSNAAATSGAMPSSTTVCGTARRSEPGARAYDVLCGCFEAGVLVRTTGETVALSPPLIASRAQIDEIVGTLATVLGQVA